MGKIRTYTGRLVDPFNPTLADIEPVSMLHSVCLINRFTGQSRWPYSVGQHTLNLYNYVPEDLKPAALVHDLSESWFNDLASPVKKECPEYKDAEHHATWFIADQLGVSMVSMDQLDDYDKRMYKNERLALFPVVQELGMGDQYDPLPGIPECWFEETPWRTVRTKLTTAFNKTFPHWRVERY